MVYGLTHCCCQLFLVLFLVLTATLVLLLALVLFPALILAPVPVLIPSLIAATGGQGIYYFRARCDGSGLHIYAVTFEEHVNNACPTQP